MLKKDRIDINRLAWKRIEIKKKGIYSIICLEDRIKPFGQAALLKLNQREMKDLSLIKINKVLEFFE